MCVCAVFWRLPPALHPIVIFLSWSHSGHNWGRGSPCLLSFPHLFLLYDPGRQTQPAEEREGRGSYSYRQHFFEVIISSMSDKFLAYLLAYIVSFNAKLQETVLIIKGYSWYACTRAHMHIPRLPLCLFVCARQESKHKSCN